MTDLSRALERLAVATDAVEVLDSACTVFGDVLTALRRHQEDDVSAFPAFVRAACAAANGRDWTGGVWTQPADGWKQDGNDEPLLNGANVTEVADAIAGASDTLAVRLAACVLSAANEAERACCESAAAEAATIRALMSGVGPP